MAPAASAARFPHEYGQTPETLAELIPWDETAARIAAAANYVLGTTTETGHPYLRPVDGVFVDDTLAFGGSPATRWVRHLQRRPEVSACLPDDDQAIILEGAVELVTDPELPLAGRVQAANVAKYPQYFATGEERPFHPFWALRPRWVYAWSLTGFPRRATRYDFDSR